MTAKVDSRTGGLASLALRHWPADEVEDVGLDDHRYAQNHARGSGDAREHDAAKLCMMVLAQVVEPRLLGLRAPRPRYSLTAKEDS